MMDKVDNQANGHRRVVECTLTLQRGGQSLRSRGSFSEKAVQALEVAASGINAHLPFSLRSPPEPYLPEVHHQLHDPEHRLHRLSPQAVERSIFLQDHLHPPPFDPLYPRIPGRLPQRKSDGLIGVLN